MAPFTIVMDAIICERVENIVDSKGESVCGRPISFGILCLSVSCTVSFCTSIMSWILNFHLYIISNKFCVFQGERGPYTRPWQSPVPPLETSVDVLVQYPSDSEDTGMVLAAWRGPSSVSHFNE